MSDSFIASIYTKIVTAFETPLNSYAQSIASQVMPVFGAIFTLYIVYVVYRMYSKKDALFEEFTNYLILFAIVGLFIGGAGKYYSSVIPFVLNSGDEIASTLSSNPTNSISAVDNVYNAFQQGIYGIKTTLDDQSLWNYFNGDNLDLIISLLFLYLAQFIFSVLITINLLIAKVMVVMLLSVGVIFIAFAIFPATRNMFFSWVGLCFNYILLNVLYSVAAKMAGDYIVNSFGTVTDGLDIAGVSAKSLISVAIIVLAINQIPTLVSSLTGGVGISAFTVNSNTLSRMAGGIGKMIGKGAQAAGKAGYHAGNFATKGGFDKASRAAKTWKSNATNAVKDSYNARTGRGSAGQ